MKISRLLPLALLLAAWPAHADINRVGGAVVSAAGSSTPTNTFTSPNFNIPLAGAIAVHAEINSAACSTSTSVQPSIVNSIFDNSGNTFAFVASLYVSAGPNCAIEWVACQAIAANSADSVTLTTTANVAYTSITVNPYTGAMPSCVDRTFTGTATGSNSVTSNSFTPLAPREMSIAMMTESSPGQTFSAGPGYTISVQGPPAGVANFMATQDQLNIPAGSQTASMSVGTSVSNLQILGMTLKAASIAVLPEIYGRRGDRQAWPVVEPRRRREAIA